MIVLSQPLALALAAPLLAALVLHHRRAPGRRYEREAGVVNPLLAFAASRLPRRRRPLLLLTLEASTVVLACLAASQPQLLVQVEVRVGGAEESVLHVNARPAVAVALDVSGSMSGEKIAEAKRAVKLLVERLSRSFDVGLVAFSDHVVASVPPTSNASRVLELVEKLKAGGGTMYTYPLEACLSWLGVYRDFNASAFVVFVTDGLPADRSMYREVLKKLAERRIPVYTVFIGSDPKGVEETKYMAKATGGEQFTARTASELADKLLEVASRIEAASLKVSAKVEARVRAWRAVDLTWVPAAAAALLALASTWARYRASRLAI